MEFKHKKSLGQHFLTSNIVPTWLTDAGVVAADDTVVEIGPGTGILTAELLDRGAHVIALEADTRALAILTNTFAAAIASGQLQLLHVDARTFGPTDIPTLTDRHYKVVANIPYYLSGHLFRTWLQTPVQPNTLVFLVQKEVAKRVCATDKQSLLSLAVTVYGTPTYVRTVSRGHFNPPPKVDSGIVAVADISKKHFSNRRETDFFSIIHLGFAQKRKQLLGNLSHTYQREAVSDVFTQLHLSPTVRAEDVTLNQWLALTTALADVPKIGSFTSFL